MYSRWLVPVSAITGGLLLLAWLVTGLTGYSSAPPWGLFGYAWLRTGVVLFGLILLWRIVRRGLSGEPSPLAVFKEPGLYVAIFAFALAGFVQVAFNWIKPQIALLAPFRYDETLAAMDVAIFGQDAWRALALLEPLDPFINAIYQMWFPALIVSFTLVAMRTPSESRNIAILAYFLLWGVFGPLGQLAVPAAGPVFYERIGLGDRFTGLGFAPNVQAGSDYLWALHVGQVNDMAAGISAMPSMHVALAFWMAIAFWKEWLRPIAALYFVAVLIGSVTTGWHYFVDGVAGCLGAIVCWRVAGLILYRRKAAPDLALAT